MTEKRFTSWGNRIKRNGKLLNIEFKTKLDAKLCCKLCNQMDKHQQEYIDELNEIFKWYKEYYGETILDTRMGWNDDNKISKLEKENEQLKQRITTQSVDREQLCKRIDEVRKENEQLKQFKEDVFNKIDMHLRMLPTARDNEFNEENGDPSLYLGAIYMLETLKEELQE